MKKGILKGLVAIITLAAAASAYSNHYHSWMKMNESSGQDAFGNRVVVCNWKCNSDYQNPHMTQTQGSGFCPTP